MPPMPMNTHAETRSPIAQAAAGKGIDADSAEAASAPCATMTAVQPSSWMMLSVARSPAPRRPNGSFTQSIAPVCIRAPMRPTAYRRIPPKIWPATIAHAAAENAPEPRAPAAMSIPVCISAIETAAPNQTSPHCIADVPLRVSILFCSLRWNYPSQVLRVGTECPLSARTPRAPQNCITIIPQSAAYFADDFEKGAIAQRGESTLPVARTPSSPDSGLSRR